MRRLIGLAALVFVGVLAWRIGGLLSADAIGMAVGVVFGVMAGIPTALLVLASDRHRDDEYVESNWERTQPAPYPQMPPILIVQPPAQSHLQPPVQPHLPSPAPAERQLPLSAARPQTRRQIMYHSE